MEVSLATAQPRAAGIDAVAAATRRLIDAVVRAGDSLDADAPDLIAQLDAVTARVELRAKPQPERIATMWANPGPGRFDPSGGTENPISPPVTLHLQPDGTLRGEAILGVPYQGPPGHVHGGISAMLLDHALGVVNARAGHSGVTVGLNVSFHRGIPIGSAVEIVSRHDRCDGRKVYSSGELRVDGRICVSATGTFVRVDDPSTQARFRRPTPDRG